MKHLFAIPVLVFGFQFASFGQTIVPGTQIQVRADGPITVARWDKGRIYPGHVAQDVYARDGDVAIPRGSYAELTVRQTGPDQLALDLESVTVNGRRFAVDSSGPQYNVHRDDYDRDSGLVGGIVGAIAGATGNNVNVEARGREIHVPGDAVLTFQLQQPLHVVTWADPGYDQNGNHYHRDHDWYR